MTARDHDQDPPRTKRPQNAASASDRNARVAASLRDNLLKRKALSRARAARPGDGPSGAEPRETD